MASNLIIFLKKCNLKKIENITFFVTNSFHLMNFLISPDNTHFQEVDVTMVRMILQKKIIYSINNV